MEFSPCLRIRWQRPKSSGLGYLSSPDILARRGDSMIEGWYNDDHLILFDGAEVPTASDRYAISELLPGYRVIGLRGWDDFILQDLTGRTYRVPTVPAIARYLSPYDLPPSGS